jgi:hypothetical protein
MAGIAVFIATLGVAPVAAAADTPDQVALATLDRILQGDFPAAAAPFDPTLQKRLPVQALEQAWSAYQKLLGPYQSHGDPEDTPRDDLVVVNVPLQMEQKPGQFRVSVHPDGTISGLYFLKEGVPVPESPKVN